MYVNFTENRFSDFIGFVNSVYRCCLHFFNLSQAKLGLVKFFSNCNSKNMYTDDDELVITSAQLPASEPI